MLYQRFTDEKRFLASRHDGSVESVRRIREVIHGTSWNIETTTKRLINNWDWSKGRPPAQRWSAMGGIIKTYFLINNASKIRKRQEIKENLWVVREKGVDNVFMVSDKMFRSKYGEHPIISMRDNPKEKVKRNYFT